MSRTCIFCGKKDGMETRTGLFTFTPPSNIPGGVMSIPNAVWEECAGCHEILIPHALHISLEKEVEHRRSRK